MLVAGLSKLRGHIAPKRRGVHDVVLRHIRMEHGKALVMLGGEYHVLHPGFFGGAHPFLRVEEDRIERAR